ncbi:hypothetical protein [Kocuria sp. cx-455]|uniref:hypothetical protein n=1 Tax=Kocuria sp. cx-455 TaxID=2771377 RepID=UPI002804F245|nr:hypothetical protein [Kocuria sp. cx-455]
MSATLVLVQNGQRRASAERSLIPGGSCVDQTTAALATTVGPTPAGACRLPSPVGTFS